MGSKAFSVGFACLLVISFAVYSSQAAWAEGGLRIVDTYGYPKSDTQFEQHLEVPPVCTEQDDPNDRYSCAFAINKVEQMKKAKELIHNLIVKSNDAEDFNEPAQQFNNVIPNIENPEFSKFLNQDFYGPVLPTYFHLSSVTSSKITPVYGPQLQQYYQ